MATRATDEDPASSVSLISVDDREHEFARLLAAVRLSRAPGLVARGGLRSAAPCSFVGLLRQREKHPASRTAFVMLLVYRSILRTAISLHVPDLSAPEAGSRIWSRVDVSCDDFPPYRATPVLDRLRGLRQLFRVSQAVRSRRVILGPHHAHELERRVMNNIVQDERVSSAARVAHGYHVEEMFRPRSLSLFHRHDKIHRLAGHDRRLERHQKLTHDVVERRLLRPPHFQLACGSSVPLFPTRNVQAGRP